MDTAVAVEPISASRSKKIRRALGPHIFILLARAIGLVTGICVQLFMAQKITRLYGIEEYGYVMLAAGIPALLPFASIGVTAPVINDFAVYDEAGSSIRAVETLRAAFRVLTKVSAALILIAILLSLSSAWDLLLGIPSAQHHGLNTVMVLIMVGVSISLYGGVGIAVLVGMGDVLQTLIYQSLQPAVVFVSVLILISSDAPPLYFATTVPASQLVVGIASLWAANRKCNNILIPAMIDGVLHRSKYTKVFGQAAPMAAVQTARAVGLQSDRVVLSHVSSASQLGQYSVVAPMYQAGVSVVSVLALSLWPIFTRRRGQAGVRRFLVGSSSAFAVIGIIMALGLFFAGPIVYSAVAGTPPPGSSIFLLFGILIFVTSTLQPISMYLTTRRGLTLQAGATIVTQAANFILSWHLASSKGASGVVLASVLCMSTLLAVPLLGSIFFIEEEPIC